MDESFQNALTNKNVCAISGIPGPLLKLIRGPSRARSLLPSKVTNYMTIPVLLESYIFMITFLFKIQDSFTEYL